MAADERRAYWRGTHLRPALVIRVLSVLIAAASAGYSQGVYRELAGAVHIHSTFSTGGETIEEIAERAVSLGIDALFITDDDLLKVEYGLPFLRGLPYVRTEPGVFTHYSVEEYLREIERVDELFPELVIVAGLESAPFYYWDFSTEPLGLVLRHWNKHMIALDMESSAAYENLPVIGHDSVMVWHWSSLLLIWPLFGLIYVVAFAGAQSRVLRAGITVVSIACLLANFPFKVSMMDAYQGDLGPAPYQHYIDYVNKHGGLAFWPHPEARSTIPPQSLFGVSAMSETGPHANDLVDTYDYTAFAALYADRITATEPGQHWDKILLQYMHGERSAPIWGTGEIDYHYAQKMPLDNILTVFLAREKSRDAVLEAMKHGRMYASRGGQERLSLERFHVTVGDDSLQMGEHAYSEGDVGISVRVDNLSREPEQVRLVLVRSGAAVLDITGMTPIDLEHVDALESGERAFYRVLGYRRKAVLVSNAIFTTGR